MHQKQQPTLSSGDEKTGCRIKMLGLGRRPERDSAAELENVNVFLKLVFWPPGAGVYIILYIRI